MTEFKCGCRTATGYYLEDAWILCKKHESIIREMVSK
jgi:hypothetical protein